jgi:hypothetical protein
VGVESIEELVAAFSEWRSRKRHPREATPGALLKRAGLAAGVHGLGPVARAVKVDRRLLQAPEAPGRGRRGPSTLPSYSRVELVAPAPAVRPFAEVELPSGIKLRLYSGSPETMGLLSTVCGAGGGR